MFNSIAVNSLKRFALLHKPQEFKGSRSLADLIQWNLHPEQKQIAVISINRPEKKNALNYNFLYSLEKSLKEIESSDKDIRCLVVRSSTPGIFCAGADLTERLTMDNLGVQMASTTIRRIFHMLYKLPIPSIAAIDGVALGGGTELALACDLRVGSSRCVLGMPETGHAIIPGAGGTQKLQRVVGIANAKDLIFTGRTIKMMEAYQMGLLNYMVQLEDEKTQEDHSFKKALEIATLISKKGPVAIRAAKRALNMGEQTDLESGLKIEETCYLEIAQTTDRIEGLKAFKEKRTPDYKGK